MKRHLQHLVMTGITLFFAMEIKAQEEGVNWWFENSKRTVITNAVGWKLGVTAYKDMTLQIEHKIAAPETLETLDLTGDVEDGYSIVNIGARALPLIGSMSELHIGDSVTNIGSHAFTSCTNLAGTLVIPDSVVDVGEHAFENCRNLENIVFGKSVATIREHSFSECKSLGTLTIPDTVVNIEWAAFHGSGMTEVNIGNSVTNIGRCAFSRCPNLSGTLIIPDSVVSIEREAFSQSSNIAGLILGNSVVDIGTDAFKNCGDLGGTLVIPDSVANIGRGAFSGCKNLTGLVLGNSVTNIGSWAFDEGGLEGSLIIPDSVVNIGSCAFWNCMNLTELTLGNSVESIGTAAFVWCKGLTGTLVIPDSVTVIGNTAFANCKALAGLILGKSVAYIGDRAFQDCTGLTGALFIPDSVTYIGKYAFNGTRFPIISTPSTGVYIGQYAFSTRSETLTVYYRGSQPPSAELALYNATKDVTSWVTRDSMASWDVKPYTPLDASTGTQTAQTNSNTNKPPDRPPVTWAGSHIRVGELDVASGKTVRTNAQWLFISSVQTVDHGDFELAWDPLQISLTNYTYFVHVTADVEQPVATWKAFAETDVAGVFTFVRANADGLDRAIASEEDMEIEVGDFDSIYFTVRAVGEEQE